MISLDDVRAASRRIAGVVHRTPVLTSAALDDRVGATFLCKAENLQRTGSFKPRGAYTRISALTAEERQRGVVAYSSGNHAQAVAFAARTVGTRAVLVMPADAPEVKRAAVEGYGGEIVTYDRDTEEREAIAQRLADERGLTVVPPYDDHHVMAGQGTVALELVEDAGGLDLLVVPVGGGGLIAGCATAARGLLPDIEVVGVEPEGADDTRRSLAAGRRVTVDRPRSIADGLLARTPGALTFPINQRLLREVVTVSEQEIVAAMLFALERMKVLLEPSGACALAALLAGRLEVRGQRVGVVLSGGNVGAPQLAELLRGA